MNHLLLLSNGIDVYCLWRGSTSGDHVAKLYDSDNWCHSIVLIFSSTWNKTFYRFSKQGKKKKKIALYMHNKYTKSYFFFFRSYPKSIFINILEFNFQCLFQSSQTLGFVYISVHVWLTLVYKCFSKKKKQKVYKPIYKYFTTEYSKGMY